MDVFSGVCLFVSVFVCLFVCLAVCLFVRAIMSERLNIGRSNLAVRYIVQKYRPSSKVKVKGQGQRTRSPGTKKRKTAEGVRRMQHAARSNRRYHCVPSGGVTGYAGGKISACCLVLMVVNPFSRCIIYKRAQWPAEAESEASNSRSAVPI